MPPRLRKHSTLVFGESKTGKDDTEELLAADANLVASGVSKDATCDQLKGFLAGKGINVTDIELISNAPERRTNTFRIAIKAQSGGNIHPERRDGYGRDHGGGAGGARAQYGGQGGHHHRRDNRGDQYATNAPSADQFHLDTQNRFNGLLDNVDN